MKICPHCKEEMTNPFGQFFFCKSECDLKLKRIPKIISKVTEPLRSLGEVSEEVARTVRITGATLAKLYPLRLGEHVVLTKEGHAAWSKCWGSDGQVDPASYPYNEGDRGIVIKVETGFTTILMVDHGKWWIRIREVDLYEWFEKV